MGLNKQKSGSNMYGFTSITWNPIRGECKDHDCSYCYMKRFPNRGPLRLVEKEFNTDLGSGNFIFIGSSSDIFSKSSKSEWIFEVLNYCSNFDNQYLFQTKDPARFFEFLDYFPPRTVLGTTIESNFDHHVSKAPAPVERAKAMIEIVLPPSMAKMVTVEPVMRFDLKVLVDWIRQIAPEWVNVGADSKGHQLPEPSWSEIQELIQALQALSEFTEVKLKRNLGRLRKTRE